jgi:hypothetical protein
MHQPTYRRHGSTIEPLENRRLLAGEPWGPLPKLVRQDVLAAQLPSATGAGTSVAVIDSGVDYTHPALGGAFGPGHKVVDGYDFYDNDADPMDTAGHGTHVASLIAGNEYVVNGNKYQGIAPGANIVALRVTDGVNGASDAMLENALQWVLANRQRLNIVAVNVSLGYGHFNTDNVAVNPTFGDELKQLADVGVPAIAAAGNQTISNGPGMLYPAADPNVIAVGGVDRFDTIQEFSARSAKTEVFAPAKEVVAASLGGNFATLEGTSFAAPWVAGTVALMKQADPSMTFKDIVSALRVSGKDNKDGDTEFGTTTGLTFPRLDVFSAVKLAQTRKPAGNGVVVGQYGNLNDLKQDQYGVLHFAYFDSRDRTLKYATKSVGGTWSTPVDVDNTTVDMGQYVSMTLDPMGRPVFAYFDGFAGDLKFASYDGAQFTATTVDAKGSVGLYPQIAYNSARSLVISYYAKTAGDLRVATQNAKTKAWTVSTVDTDGDVGRSGSLTLDNDGKLAIGYEDSSRGWLRMARQQANGTWQLNWIDKATQGVAFISLAFDTGNRPHLSYYDAAPANLKYIQWDGAGWVAQTLASKGAVGLYSKLTLDQADRATILFYNRTRNQLLSLGQQAAGAGGSTTWTATVLTNTGGRYIAGTPVTAGGTSEFLYSFYDLNDLSLKLQPLS